MLNLIFGIILITLSIVGNVDIATRYLVLMGAFGFVNVIMGLSVVFNDRR